MTWYCRPCGKNNPPSTSKCKGCHRPWEEVWEAPKRRRSASAWRSGKDSEKKEKKEKDKKDKESGKAMTSEIQFPDDLPWVASTPQTRNQIRQVKEVGSTELPLVPPPPPLVCPPIAPAGKAAAQLSDVDQKKLENLRGLKAAGMVLPESMEALYQDLEKQSKDSTPVTISHSQINRLNKLRSQISTISTRIMEMDKRWASFMQTILLRVREHGQQYQQCRADLLVSLQTKQEELKGLKESISLASQSLTLQQTEEPVMLHTEQDFQETMQELNQFQQLAAQAPCHLIEDDDMSQDLEVAPTQEESEEELIESALKPSPHTTFRGAPSPNRVANQVLKEKHKKEVKHKSKAAASTG